MPNFESKSTRFVKIKSHFEFILKIIDDENDLKDISPLYDISFEYMTYWGCLPYVLDSTKTAVLISDPYSIEQHKSFFYQLWHTECSFYLIRRSRLEHLIADICNKKSQQVPNIENTVTLIEFMKRDKKNKDGKIAFSLPAESAVKVEYFTEEQLKLIIEEIG